MSARQLLLSFEDGLQPVRLNDVRDAVLALSDQDRISFVPVPTNEDILRGSFLLYRRRPGVYAEPLNCADVLYSDRLDGKWRRLVCVKEMIHLLDPPAVRASSKEAVSLLIAKLASPHEVQMALQDPARSDRRAILQALGILFPWSAREAVLPAYKEGRKTVGEIADFMGLPSEYVAFVLQEVWADFYPLMMNEQEEVEAPPAPTGEVIPLKGVGR